MSFKRFVAANTKDAMAQVRRELGSDAVILANRRIANGHIEILAAGADTVEAIVEDARRPAAARPLPGQLTAVQIAPGVRRVGPPVETFQEYLRRQPAAVAGSSAGPTTAGAAAYRAVETAPQDDEPLTLAPITRPTAPATLNGGAASGSRARPAAPAFDTWLPNQARPAPAGAAAAAPAVFRRRPSRESLAAVPPAAPLAPIAAVAPVAAAGPVVPVAPLAPAAAAPSATAGAAPAPAAAELQVPTDQGANAQLMAELASLRASLQQQLASLSTTVAATDSMRRNPLQTRVMTRLLSSGFSVDVARRIALATPALADAAAADGWLQDVLAHNLRAGDDDGIVERGGVYALVGPTGVGKTTTVAKLAARFAVRHGAAALGLITLDAYRVAAAEQLRTYGRILGTPVHLAQDAATLRELLGSMQNKRLVLIDTCGVGPRDERLAEMLDLLAQAGSGARRVQPVLLLNAASHAETLDETARAWRAPSAAGTILTKLDEAARIGGALDCALRYKLRLLALTNGQRVPEDLHPANARLLAHLALKPSSQLFALAEEEGTALAQLTAMSAAARGSAHA